MKLKHIAIMALLSLMPVIGSFIFPTLIGSDSFYFYVFSCGREGLLTDQIPIVSKLFFELLPCNIFLFKSISFFAIFASAIIVGKIGELYNQKDGWLAGILVFISIAFVHGLIIIEDDILGIPFLFAANYFFLKGIREKQNSSKVFAVLLTIFVGALLWKGALLYLVAFTFFSVFGIIVLYVSLYYIGFGSMHALLGNDLIQENANALLLSFLGSKTIGLGHGIGLLGLYVLNRRVWLALPFLVAMLLNAKWAIHLSPFLGLGLMFLVTDLNDFRIRKGIEWREWWANKYFLWIFVGLVLVSTFFLSVGLLFQSPNVAQIEAVEFAVLKANGEVISNDWSYGYYIMFFDGNTQEFGGGWPRFSESLQGNILLTENTEVEEGYRLLRVWPEAGFYGADIKVYEKTKK